MEYDQDYRTGLANAQGMSGGAVDTSVAQAYAADKSAQFAREQHDGRMAQAFQLFVKAHELREDAAFMADFRAWIGRQRTDMMRILDDVAS